MIEKGNTPGEYIDCLYQALGKPRGNAGAAVRDAVREWLTQGGDQALIATRHGVAQPSLSRLISQLREIDQLFGRAAEFHKSPD